MKKSPTQNMLIELAKKAPKVEYKEPAKKNPNKKPTGGLADFLLLLDIKAGRNEVSCRGFFDLFTRWDTDGLTYRQFRKTLTQFVKFDRKKVNCRLNKKLITIQEEFKELSSENEEDE